MALKEVSLEEQVECLGDIGRGLTRNNIALLSDDIEVVNEGAVLVTLATDFVKGGWVPLGARCFLTSSGGSELISESKGT
jgi:hypothetical protein